ncbi:MAG: helicase-exonuclease AddAB subunit AddB [Candidatus Kapaibacteriales bacterium]
MLVIHKKKQPVDSIFNPRSLEFYDLENDDTIYIFPTRRYIRYLKRDVICKGRYADDRSGVFENVYTLEDFALEILKSEGQEINLVERYEQHTLVYESVSELQSELEYYRETLSFNSLINISEIIIGLRGKGLNHKDIKAVESESISQRKKSADLVKIFKRYELKLTEKSDLVDEVSLFNKAAKKAIEKYEDYNKILVYGFHSFTEPELEFLKRISTIAKEPFIYFRYRPENRSLYKPIKDLADRITLSEDTNGELESTYFNRLENEESFDATLFNNRSKSHEVSSCMRFSIVEGEDKIEEVKKCTIFLKHLFSKEVNPNQCLVISKSSSDYSSIVREIFTLENIPTNITDRFILSESPYTNALILVLNAILEDFPKERIADIYSSRLLKTQEGLNSTSDILFALSSIRYTSFSESKAKMATAVFTQVEQTRNLHKRTDELIKAKRSNIVRQIYDDLRELSEEKEKVLTHGKFSELCLKIFKKYDVLSVLKEFNRTVAGSEGQHYTMLRTESERDSQAFVKLIECIEIFSKSGSNNNNPIEEENIKYSFEELLRRFKVLLSTTRYQIPELGDYGVNVTSIEQARMLEYKYIFFLGMNEGIFPDFPLEDISVGDGILNEDKGKKDDKILFADFLQFHSEGYQEKEIYMLYHTSEGSQTKIRSTFLEELIRKVNQDNIQYYTSESINEDDELSKLLSEELNIFEIIGNNDSDTKQNARDIRAYRNKIINRGLSITDVESYANCPNKYLYDKFLKVRSSEELPELSQTNLERGKLYHDILEDFTNYLLKRIDEFPSEKSVLKPGLVGFILSGENRNNYYRITEELLVLKFKEVDILAPDLDYMEAKRVLRFAIDRIIEEGRTIISSEVKFDFYHVVEIHDDDFEVRKEKYNIKFRGRIDRIDARYYGEDLKFDIVDYKAGNELPSITNKNTFQLYAYANGYAKTKGLSEEEIGLLQYSSLNPRVGIDKSLKSIASKSEMYDKSKADEKNWDIKGNIEEIFKARFSSSLCDKCYTPNLCKNFRKKHF